MRSTKSLAKIINTKVVIIAVLFLLLALVIGYFLMENVKKDTYTMTKDKLNHIAKMREGAKLNVGISNAVTISQNSDIVKALKTNNRKLAIDTLKGISAVMKAGTPFNNIKVHIHDKNLHSFLRNWKPDKFGDDLSSFRETIVKVKQTQKPLSAIEVGRAGLVLRGLSPIVDKDGNYLGSIEFIQGFNSVAKAFDKDNEAFLVLMDQKFKRGDALTAQQKVQNYYISQKFINEDFKANASKLDFEKLLKDGYIIDDNYFYTYTKIKDLNGEKVGIYLIGEKYESLQNTVLKSANIVNSLLAVMVLLIIAIIVSVSIVVTKVVSGGIKKFTKSFDNFLKFVTFETNQYTKADVYGDDEIAELLNMVNKTAAKFDKSIKEDMRVIGEIVLTTDKVEQGIYKCIIHSSTDNPMIMTLKDTINKMVKTLNKDFTELRTVLKQYTNNDFTSRVNIDPRLKEDMLKVMQRVNALGDALAQSAKTNLSNGQHLEANSTTMTNSVNNLANKANQQAASLEETAAAVEEITSITRNNAENATKMSSLGTQVRSEVSSGMNLAARTSSSMDDINTQVTSINEAITIIDQIAFQTNILSLNAAVEAATAGEAGKGFAVVAQEVRNLASRSAEAANEIKTLVETAATKANDGKNISDNMIKGYESLNEKFNETIHLIEDVSNASKEQMTGIEQINDAVSMLDKVTQENANEANSVAQIASEVNQMANELVSDAQSKKF